MKCKSCNATMQDDELMMIDPLSGDHVELCRICLGHADDALLDDDSQDINYYQYDEEDDWRDDDYGIS